MSAFPLRIFLVDDHPLVREWLASMISLEPGLQVCGQAEEAVAALASIPLAMPDVAVVDLTMPRGSGLDLIRALRVQCPSVRILVLTGAEDAKVVDEVFQSGAHGYVGKKESGSRIIGAIREVARDRWMPPAPEK